MQRWKKFFLEVMYFTLFNLLLHRIFGWQDITVKLVVESIFIGILSAIMFMTVFWRVMRYMAKKLEETVPVLDLQPEEQLLLKGPSGHFKGRITIGGVLFLTDKRLVFKSHKLNFTKADAEISMNAIASANLEQDKSGKIFRLEVADSNVHRFVVDGAVEWVRRLSA